MAAHTRKTKLLPLPLPQLLPIYIHMENSAAAGGQNGTYEFFDIEYTGWYGDVVDPGGNGAGLDTSSTGSKSVTCNGLMRFRCSGGEDIAGPVSVNGTGTYTVTDSVEPLTVSIDPGGDVPVFMGESQTFVCYASGGEEPYTYSWSSSGSTPSSQLGASNTFSATFGTLANSVVSATVKDKNGREKSSQVSVKVIKIKSYTDKRPAPRNRQTIGLLEEVSVSVVDANDAAINNVQWSLSEGAQSSISTDGELIAAKFPEEISVIATVGQNSKSYPFSIIKPQNLEGIKINGDAKLGTVTSLAGMEIEVGLLPKTVCFGALEVIETSGGGDEESEIHETWPVAVGVDDWNLVLNTDKVRVFRPAINYQTFQWTWLCNWNYSFNGDPEIYPLKQLDQKFDLEINDVDSNTRVLKIKLEKFEVSVDNHSSPITRF